MTLSIPLWLKNKASNSNNRLLRRLVRSLKRDRELPFRFLVRKAIIYLLSLVTGKMNLRRCDKVGKHARTRRRPYIENMGSITIGDAVNINSRNVQTDLVTGPGGVLEIGDEVSINFGVSIVANNKVQIGNRIRIGPYTMIYDSNMHVHGKRFERASGDPVIIEDDVWLASKVVVLKGSRIGKGSIIASGSVVSGIIPPYVVAGGTPAKIIKFLDPPRNSGFYWEHNGRRPDIKKNISQRVRKIAAEIFSIDANTLEDWHTHNSCSGWNSLQHVKFIHALEREFDIHFKKKDWTRLSSLGKIDRVVQSYINKKIKQKKLT